MNFVHREDRSLQATTLSEFCNSVWWLFHRVALVHGTLYSCEHRDPPNTCDVFIEVSPILHKTISSKANWLWKCCDEYKSCRPLYPNQNPAQNMRYAAFLHVISLHALHCECSELHGSVPFLRPYWWATLQLGCKYSLLVKCCHQRCLDMHCH